MSDNSVRIDKFLWAARFFKTRSLATDAVDGGKVKLNGERVKPAKGVKPGDRIVLPMGWDEADIVVLALSDKRGSATLAQTLYRETPESIARRAERAEMRRLTREPAQDIKARPTKRDRRQLDNLG
jgi:ribosome-associated heat shock protein Hsp15